MAENLLNGKFFERERNYGIDLLRILSMFMVVLLHVNNFGGLLVYSESANLFKYTAIWISEALAICAVNVYAMISGYVLFNSKFKLKRILQLYLEVFFFNLISYILIIITKNEWVNVKEFIKGIVFILPLKGETFWYFKAYFLLFFIFPLLNITVKNMNKKQFLLFFTVVGVFICILSHYGHGWGFSTGYSFVWLVTLYFIGAYFKKFGFLQITALKSFIIYCCLSVLILLIRIINNAFLPLIQIVTVGQTLNLKYDSYAYTSIFVVLQAVFLFNSFAKIQIKNSFWQKVLLFVSPLTFGVYIVHCTEFGKSLFNYFAFIANCSVWLIIPLTIGCAFLAFIVCAIIEWIKQLIFKFARIDKLTDITGDFIQGKITAFAEKKSAE